MHDLFFIRTIFNMPVPLKWPGGRSGWYLHAYNFILGSTIKSVTENDHG